MNEGTQNTYVLHVCCINNIVLQLWLQGLQGLCYQHFP